MNTHSDSLAHKAYFRLIKLALVFSLIIVTIFSLISLKFYRSGKIKDINQSINKVLNNVFSYELKANHDLIIKELQKKTHLKEISLYSKNCDLRAFSAISMASPACPRNDQLQLLSTSLGEEELFVYYDLGFSDFQVLRENMLALIVLLATTFFITAFALLYFLRMSFLRPMALIQQQVEQGKELDLPKEFEFLTSKIQKFKDSVSKFEQEKTYYDLARRVVHDIRNPLAFIKIHLKDNELQPEMIELKVSEIEYQVSSLLGQSKNESSDLNLLSYPRKLKTELEYVFDLEVIVESTLSENDYTSVSLFDLNNIFSNLARNSKEAGATKVEIIFRAFDSNLVVNFNDNGRGVPQELQHKVFEKDFTSKSHGHGIGLSSIRDFLGKTGGGLCLDTTYVRGASFCISLPFLKKELSEIVFIDDDKYLRAGWVKAGKQKGIQVHSFSTVEEFMMSTTACHTDTPIYVDSNLGSLLRGEVESKSLFEVGYCNIFLCTSYPEVDLLPYPWIKSIVSKEPPFLLSSPILS
jgi:signal transduction histidine kinase